MTVRELWAALEKDAQTAQPGFLFRRIPSARDLRLAIDQASGRRMLLLGVSSADSTSERSELPVSTGFSLRALPDTRPGRTVIQLQMGLPAFRDVFTVLVEDVVSQIVNLSTDRLALDGLLLRLVRWQEFLKAAGPDGLSETAQRGLFGELHFLRHELMPAVGPGSSVQSWAGPLRAPQDFQLPGRSIEVKVSAAKQLQRLRISSERQLDDVPGGGRLLLMHISVDVRDTGDATLPGLVAELRAALASDPATLSLFEDRLFLAGYLDAHADRYGRASYAVRELNFFHVHGAFPRITERMLIPGTGDVTYALALSACMPFRITEAAAREIIAEHP